MTAFLEVWTTTGPELRALDAERVSIGKGDGNDVALPADASVSGLHAVLERYGTEWAVRDVGSSNGTFVNGERILGEQRLRHGDEILVGKTRLVYRASEPSQPARTETAEAAPELTRREREVLLALCRPVLHGAMFTKPASIKEIASALYVTENAVKQHLGRLYEKFGIFEGRKSVELANEAIRRGAVNLADLKELSRSDPE